MNIKKFKRDYQKVNAYMDRRYSIGVNTTPDVFALYEGHVGVAAALDAVNQAKRKLKYQEDLLAKRIAKRPELYKDMMKVRR